MRGKERARKQEKVKNDLVVPKSIPTRMLICLIVRTGRKEFASFGRRKILGKRLVSIQFFS